MLHRLCVAPIVEGGTIRGVITESKAGREAILAQRVIDATGDADLATRAGAPVHKTPREKMMAASSLGKRRTGCRVTSAARSES